MMNLHRGDHTRRNASPFTTAWNEPDHVPGVALRAMDERERGDLVGNNIGWRCWRAYLTWINTWFWPAARRSWKESENEGWEEWLDSQSNKTEWIKEKEGSVLQVAVATNKQFNASRLFACTDLTCQTEYETYTSWIWCGDMNIHARGIKTARITWERMGKISTSRGTMSTRDLSLGRCPSLLKSPFNGNFIFSKNLE